MLFLRAADRLFYLQLLAEFLPHYGVAPEGYCLMDNHVHLIAIPHDRKRLSRALQRIHRDYARATHIRLRRMVTSGKPAFTPLRSSRKNIPGTLCCMSSEIPCERAWSSTAVNGAGGVSSAS